MAFSLALGYATSVWTCIRGALQVVGALQPTNTATTRAILLATATTLRRGRDSIAAWQIGLSLSTAFSNLDAASALPLVLTPTVLVAVQARIAAVKAMSDGTTAMLPVPMMSTALVTSGLPGMADPGLIEWLMTALVETPPAGITVDNFAAAASAAADAWDAVTTALSTQGVNYVGSTYDACSVMASASRLVAADVAQMPVSPATDMTTAWNGLVAVPTLLRVAAFGGNDPTTDTGQQISVMRYLIGTALGSVNVALVNLGDPTPSSIVVATVRAGDSLMDIAARTMGDYTRWRDIATVNALVPPYIVAVRPTDGSAVAAVGDQIYLPTSTDPTAVTAKLNYATNYLGTDVYFGPLGGTMPIWNGDFETISGYANLGISLGRRIQTTVGTLIYHSEFGSRIPPEVGSVQTQSVVSSLGAYAESALAADPRVDEVSSVTVTLQNNYAINIVAQVIPNGLTGGVEVNEVLPPLQ